MITFRQYLAEGGSATEEYGTERANKNDIEAVLRVVSKALQIPVDTLAADLLGSTRVTLAGKRKDSGDIDIAMSLEDSDVKTIDAKMLALANGQGAYNPGTKVGSYAVPANGKKIQVDLMYVKNKDWARFIYHSEIGDGSKYSGAARNLMLRAALAVMIEPDKDFVHADETGREVARARKGITMDQGLRRIFRLARVNAKTGKHNKSMTAVEPEELAAFMKSIGKDVKFSMDRDATDNPKEVVEFIFGPGTDPKAVGTAEGVLALIKKHPKADEIMKIAKSESEKLNFPIPS